MGRKAQTIKQNKKNPADSANIIAVNFMVGHGWRLSIWQHLHVIQFSFIDTQPDFVNQLKYISKPKYTNKYPPPPRKYWPFSVQYIKYIGAKPPNVNNDRILS